MAMERSMKVLGMEFPPYMQDAQTIRTALRHVKGA